MTISVVDAGTQTPVSGLSPLLSLKRQLLLFLSAPKHTLSTFQNTTPLPEQAQAWQKSPI